MAPGHLDSEAPVTKVPWGNQVRPEELWVPLVWEPGSVRLGGQAKGRYLKPSPPANLHPFVLRCTHTRRGTLSARAGPGTTLTPTDVLGERGSQAPPWAGGEKHGREGSPPCLEPKWHVDAVEAVGLRPEGPAYRACKVRHHSLPSPPHARPSDPRGDQASSKGMPPRPPMSSRTYCAPRHERAGRQTPDHQPPALMT